MYYFVKFATSHDLLNYFHVVLKLVEDVGYRVVRVVTDGASINVSFFTLLAKSEEQPWKMKHPLDETRVIFLSFDYTHLLKNIRNQFHDRDFLIDGRRVSWKYIRMIHDMQETMLLKLARSLTRKHIDPSNLERQKVK